MKWVNKYAHRKHTRARTHTAHAESLQSASNCSAFPLAPVKNAIPHGVVNMKNKQTCKSLLAVNYLSPDCIWPFTLLSVANYKPSWRTLCNLGIGMSNRTAWIQMELLKTSEPCLCGLFVISLIPQSGSCSLFWYLLTTGEFYDKEAFTIIF